MSLQKLFIALVASVLIPSLAVSEESGGAWMAEPEGMFSPTPVLARSCVAVRVALSEKQALAGIRWYHNDSATVFPKILVASGLKDYPPLYSDGITVVESASGEEIGWSEATFNQPVASETGSLYVIFQLPVNTEGVDVGQGPGFGYVATTTGSCVYLSADGDDWSRLQTNNQLLVDPVYTNRLPGVVALKSSIGSEDDDQVPENAVVITRTELLAPFPNPFNPTATVSFNLKDPGQVSLSIYDLRGRRIASLVDSYLASGQHKYVWMGRDRSGRRVASGVYFAKLETNGLSQVRRMLLVK